MMAVSPMQLDIGLTGSDLAAGLPPISELRRMQGLGPETDGCEAMSHLAGNVWCGKSPAPSGEKGRPLNELQEFLWQEFFKDPTQRWDNAPSKPSSRHPDFKHDSSKVALLPNARHKPAGVDWQIATWDTRMTRPAEPVSTSAHGQGWFAANEDHMEAEMCSKLCVAGRITEAVDGLSRMVQRGCHVPSNLIYRVLKRCIANKDLVLGRRIHALTVESGYEGDAFFATHFIGLYASHRRLGEAMRVFSEVSTPDAYNWATIIFAYARHGEAAQAVQLYRRMRESAAKPDNRVYLAVLKACAAAGDLIAGKEVHGHILASPRQPNLFVQNGLLDMYVKCRRLEDARKLFDVLQVKDVVTWTTMIAGYAQQGLGQEALNLYRSMQQEGFTTPNCVTFVCLLQACASIGVGALQEGELLHAEIKVQGLQDDVVLGCSLVNMYAKCGILEDARRVFETLRERDVVTWNTMIAGYAQQGMGQEALDIYSSMLAKGVSPDSATFVSVIQACASVGEGALHQGKQLHAQIEEQKLQDDVVLGCSLVNMYAKCGSLEDARNLFDRLSERDIVTWTAMIACYAQQGMGQEALGLYSRMQQDGLPPPDSFTVVCLLQACALVAGLPMGKQLHVEIEERGMLVDVVVGAALVDMYAKCGSMIDSKQVFDTLPERTVEAWGALIGGYTRQGDSEAVFHLLDRMRLEGMQPSGIIFLSVLTVCSHVGLVDKGRTYFEIMKSECGISPTEEHYTCMIDLLGRAGHLEEALQMAKAMPFPPNAAAWHTLLGACQKWNNVEIGRHAFEFAVSGDAKDEAFYVLMSNIYASAEMREAAKEMQARRVKSGAWKKPGQSWWTDMDGVVHTFVVGDKKHPGTEVPARQSAEERIFAAP